MAGKRGRPKASGARGQAQVQTQTATAVADPEPGPVAQTKPKADPKEHGASTTGRAEARTDRDPVPKTTTSGMDYLMKVRERMFSLLCPTCKKCATDEKWTTADVEEQACEACYRKLNRERLL